MNQIGVFFVLAFAFVLAVHGQTDPTTEPPQSTTTQGPDPTTIVPTTEPAPSTAEPTPSTAEPTPSTASPTETTVSQDTTPAPAPSTTVAPPTEVLANNTCIRMQMNANFNLSYVDAANKTMIESFDLPTTGFKVGGNCSNAEMATLIISSISTENVSEGMVTFTFRKDSGDYMLSKIEVSATMFEKFPASAMVDDLDLFHTSVASSYSCISKQVVTFPNNTASATIMDAQVQAFMTNTAAFSSGVECPEDAKTSNIVPIAVGASLAALVVIVLIAYLISRKRNQRGYESV